MVIDVHYHLFAGLRSEPAATDMAERFVALIKREGIENSPHAWQRRCLLILAQEVFQPLRDAFMVAIYVSSGFRSKALNRAIKGAYQVIKGEYVATSQHCKGQALDLDAHKYGRISNKTIFEYIKDNLQFDQLIWEFGTLKEPAWVHVSYVNQDENRCEILVAYKDNQGETKYRLWE